MFTVENDGCEQVSPVASLIKDNLSWLQANGSPIWKKVDLKLFHDETPERMSQCVSQ
ncbi:hypothetical protein [Cyanobacterium aponinum]|uniref:hypothetical protein n=1 Tax=Cyanobacterium aponinum TaxID=379064 RepID=UPI001F4F9279|nr:hypothetical protein [Cyanobacterium aponinum]